VYTVKFCDYDYICYKDEEFSRRILQEYVQEMFSITHPRTQIVASYVIYCRTKSRAVLDSLKICGNSSFVAPQSDRDRCLGDDSKLVHF